MFLLVSWSDLHFGFTGLFFFFSSCPIGRANKIAGPKNGTHRNKLFQPCETVFSILLNVLNFYNGIWDRKLYSICFAGSSNITCLFSAVFLTAFDAYQGRYRLQTLGCIIREQSFYGYAIVVISFKQTIMFDSNQGNSFLNVRIWIML